MRRKKPSVLSRIAQEACELEMTPMIDVTFLLLVFFLCTLQFKQLEGRLAAYLPKDAGANAALEHRPDDHRLEVELLDPGIARHAAGERAGQAWNGEGRPAFEGRSLRYRLNAFATAERDELEARLRELHAAEVRLHADPDARRKLLLVPHPDSHQGEVLTALDAALAAGFEGVRFVAAEDEPDR